MRAIRDNLKVFLCLCFLTTTQLISILKAQDSIPELRKSYFWVTAGTGHFAPYKESDDSPRGHSRSNSYDISLSYQKGENIYSIGSIYRYKTYEFGDKDLNLQGLNLSLKQGKDTYSIRYIAGKEEEQSRISPEEYVMDFGILYGRGAKSKAGLISFSGGISLLTGLKRGEFIHSVGAMKYKVYESVIYNSVGFPFEGQLFWTPLSFIGIGAKAFGNINLKNPYFGANLSIQIGWLH